MCPATNWTAPSATRTRRRWTSNPATRSITPCGPYRRVGAIAEPEQRPVQLAARATTDATGANGNGGNGNGHAGNAGPATDSQRRAIAAIARRLGVDPALEASEIIGANLDDLSLRQASELIDHLKTLTPVSTGRNSR